MIENSWIFRLLNWFCPPSLYEGIEGDLIEQWEGDRQQFGPGRAKINLLKNTLLFFQAEILLRNQFSNKYMNSNIWRSHIKVGWRNILRNKFHATINIFGLALGIGFAYLTFLYVNGELRYDKFHQKADRIVRVVEKRVNRITNEPEEISSVTAIPLAKSLVEQYPEIDKTTRYGSFGSLVQNGEDNFSQVVVVADREFFELFDYEILDGTNEPLINPSELVLSKNAAEIFFGDQTAVGKPLSVMLGDSLQLFTVTAVVNNHQGESSLDFDVLIPFENFRQVVGEQVYHSLSYGMIETYLLLDNESLIPELENKINQRRIAEAESENVDNFGLYMFQPFTNIHLDDTVSVGIARLGNPVYVYVLSGLGVLILFMACVNFISLSSSHSFSRVKEVGIRKTMGALRGQIRSQLMVETFLISVFAVFFGLGLVYLAIPLFNQLINSTVSFHVNVESLLFLIALLIVIIAVAGGVPSKFLASLQPVQALRGGVMTEDNQMVRGSLVVVQFTLSITLVIGTFVMNDQMSFISEKNMGFDQERLLEISLNNPATAEEANKIVQLFKSEASSQSRIMNVSAALNDYQEPWTQLTFELEDGSSHKLFFNLVDEGYQQTMELELVWGRWFDENANTSSSNQVVINQSMLKYLQWEDPSGKQLPGKNFSDSHEIIGVVEDFHFSSLHNQIEPLILATNFNSIGSGVSGLTTYRWPPLYNDLVVRISPGELQPALQDVESVWRAVNPDAPFIGNFVDELLDAQYINEQRWKRVINYGSIFAFAIAILGLVGLVRISLQRKMKEIGIRKVLGSNYRNLAVHFTKDFLGVLFIANLMAWPLAWWGSKLWLQSFPYRIEGSILPYLMAAALVSGGVILVVSYLTWLASRMNPVDVLRNE